MHEAVTESAAGLRELMSRLFKKERLPWTLQEALRRASNVRADCSHKISTPAGRRKSRPDALNINVTCGYHGLSGGAIAMANMASLLAGICQVTFLTRPSSNLNPLLGERVRLRRNVERGADIYIADVTFDTERLSVERESGAKLIVCCHGLPTTSHGLSPEYVKASLEAADKVVFVTPAQARAFGLPDERYAIIPNATARIEKTCATNNIGALGTLDEPRKGAARTVAVGLKSNADRIHLWGMMKSSYRYERVVTHGWETNKNRIYDSFDVLVFLSETETFGMVVIEAMSAGVPCVLSNLPAFEEFEVCPGVVLVEDDDLGHAHEIGNEMLGKKSFYRDRMIAHWRDNYSPEAIAAKWARVIEQVRS